jgi:hypothetical protein
VQEVVLVLGEVTKRVGRKVGNCVHQFVENPSEKAGAACGQSDSDAKKVGGEKKYKR